MNKIDIIALLVIFFGCTSKEKTEKKTYEAGFRTIRTFDRSRIYKTVSDTSDYLHYRPLDIDIWYPAEPGGSDTLLLFRDILSLLEKRAIFYTGSDSWKGITPTIAQSFCEGFKCSDTTRLLNYKTRSFRNATAIRSKFPLVVYLCAYNGMSYENFTLMEELSMKGYVVISVNSIGRYPGDMTMKKEDMMEQVYDAQATLRIIKQNPDIDFSKIGIIGYSWGALSGSILASHFPEAACLISLDGSEFHHYGKEKEENSDFEGIRNSAEFKEMKLSLPYLRLESSPIGESEAIDSVYNFTEKLTGKRQIIKIDSAAHEDFSCLSVVVRESGGCKTTDYFRKALKLSLEFLDENMKAGKN
jgi:hypothetical protein